MTLTGGYLYPRLRTMLGPVCEMMLSRVSADVAVMGVGGVLKTGFFNSNTLVVEPERRMIDASGKLIIVADHTKFGRGTVFHLAPLHMADVVVSDVGLADEYREMLEGQSVEVRLA